MRKLLLITMVSVTVTAQGLLSAPADAKTKSELKQMVSSLKTACKADIQEHCSDVTPGNGRVAACLNAKENKLSPACGTAWTDTKSRISKKIDKAEVAFRKDCGEDVRKFCSEIPSGKGRLLDCLDQHENALSGSCKDFQAKLQEKVAEFVG